MRTIKQVIEQSGYLDNGIEELTVAELYVLMMEYGGDVVDECAKRAMIEEHIPSDEEDESGDVSIISAGHIREEHYVKVNQESILKVKNQLK